MSPIIPKELKISPQYFYDEAFAPRFIWCRHRWSDMLQEFDKQFDVYHKLIIVCPMLCIA